MDEVWLQAIYVRLFGYPDGKTEGDLLGIKLGSNILGALLGRSGGSWDGIRFGIYDCNFEEGVECNTGGAWLVF